MAPPDIIRTMVQMDMEDWMTNCHIDMMYRKRINISLNGCGLRLFRESATMIKVSRGVLDVRCTCCHWQHNWISCLLDYCETFRLMLFG